MFQSACWAPPHWPAPSSSSWWPPPRPPSSGTPGLTRTVSHPCWTSPHVAGPGSSSWLDPPHRRPSEATTYEGREGKGSLSTTDPPSWWRCTVEGRERQRIKVVVCLSSVLLFSVQSQLSACRQLAGERMLLCNSAYLLTCILHIQQCAPTENTINWWLKTN